MTNLVLLVDQTQVAIDERERLTLLGIKAAESDDRDIERALENIKQGLWTTDKQQPTERMLEP